jgi:hypothetical protein
MFSAKTLVLALLCLGIALCATPGQPQKEQPPVARLLSDDYNTIEQAKRELFADRAHLISQLVSIVDDEQNLRTKTYSVEAAMLALGDMRAIKAIPVLVAHIGFPDIVPPGSTFSGDIMKSFGGFHRTMSFGHPYSGAPQVWPAVAALIKIGEPCLPQVITKLVNADNVFDINACLGVLLGLRDRPTIAAMLRDAMDKETDEIKKERLQHTINILPDLG